MATKRRRFTAQFKAKVAPKRCAGTARSSDRGKHEVPRCGWKRQAQAGLEEVTPARPAAASRGTIHDLHAKIGELTVERDFLSRGLGR